MKLYQVVKGKLTGRINIPAEHMKISGFKPGDILIAESEKGKITIRRKE